MQVEQIVHFTDTERSAFKKATAWVKDEDGDPALDGIFVRRLARDGSRVTAAQLMQAQAELRRCGQRLSNTDLAAVPSFLVHEGADMKAIGEDICEVALRELTPATELVESALTALRQG